MITLKEFMETFSYRITEGSAYGWQCYGHNAYQLSSWNGLYDEGGWSGNVVFDTSDQTVYEVEVCDYTNQRAYRYINPDVKDAYLSEAQDRGEANHQAWDDVKFIDLENKNDWLEKSTAIIAGKDYDTRIQVEVDLENDVILDAALEAHKQDITLNQYIERILRNMIDSEKQK